MLPLCGMDRTVRSLCECTVRRTLCVLLLLATGSSPFVVGVGGWLLCRHSCALADSEVLRVTIGETSWVGGTHVDLFGSRYLII